MTHIQNDLPDAHPVLLTHGDVSLNTETRKVTRAGNPVHLRPMEFAILRELINHIGEPLPAIELYKKIHGPRRLDRKETEQAISAMKAQINYLRKALREPNIIQSIKGKGYCLSKDGQPVPIRMSHTDPVSHRPIVGMTL